MAKENMSCSLDAFSRASLLHLESMSQCCVESIDVFTEYVNRGREIV